MWPSSSARQINYGLTTDMNMVGVGLRDLLVVAPPQHHHQDATTISFGPLHSYTNINYATASTQGGGVGVGVNLIPLLSTAPCLPSHPQARVVDADSHAPGDAQNCTAVASLLKCGSIGGEGGSGDGGLTAACLDCGNQSKKDCNHRRCRTCCKGRGYDCTTHVKSTWIPAASRRRDKQSNSSSGSKKPRLTATCSENTSTSNTTRSFDNSNSQQDTSFKESLPEQVQAPAKFKFMRFTSVEDGEEEYAYEAMVKIGGHIFKGVLHDKGIAQSKDGIPNIAELHLGGYSGGVEVLSSTKKPIYK